VSCNWMDQVQRVLQRCRVWSLGYVTNPYVQRAGSFPPTSSGGGATESLAKPEGPSIRDHEARLGEQGLGRLGAGSDPQQPAWSEKNKQKLWER
jgi:hypothetical protein